MLNYRLEFLKLCFAV